MQYNYVMSVCNKKKRRREMVTSAWRLVLPVVIVSCLITYEERLSFPSCRTLPSTHPDELNWKEHDSSEDLKVMMAANLLLLGSEAGFFDLYFRDYYMSRFFRKSFESLKPDMLLVLGDVSAKGSELTRSKWLSVLHQFHQILGPFLALPFHVILGDRDIGDCSNLDAKPIYWKARSFPGLDSAGCGAFEISNVSFVSLNAVSLLCGNNNQRFSVEKVIERESVDLQRVTEGTAKVNDETDKSSAISYTSGWRENGVTSGSGPVLLLHFPLYRSENNNYKEADAFKSDVDASGHGSTILKSRRFAGSGPYDLSYTVPPNATKYIFQALKPRIIFSAHTHQFSDHAHSDGTREITVPAMTWKARDDPGFIVATFERNRKAVSITYCSVAKESHVLIVYASMVFLLFFLVVLPNTLKLRCSRQ